MSANSFLKQYSDARAALVQSATSKAAAIIVGRRRVLSGIRWRGDLIVTAAEAIGGAEHVDIRLEGDELGAEVVATDLTTDVAVLRLDAHAANNEAQAPNGDMGTSGPNATQGGATPNATISAGAETNAHLGASPGGHPNAMPRAHAAAEADVHLNAARNGRPNAAASALASATVTARPNAAADALRLGEPILVVGRTLRGPMAIWGSVQLAGPAWNSRRGGRIDQRLELDLALDSSFEGGAVLDMDGNVAAMAVPGPYHRVLGIPTATIETVVAKVSQFGHLPRPYIGIRLQPLWLDDDTRTKLGRKSRGIAAVGGVDAGSPAANAHIELGDLLLTVDGEPAEGVNGLAQRIAAINPGQTIALEVLRGGKPLTINVQVGERPHH
jgi:S1-C subfamily serine protease